MDLPKLLEQVDGGDAVTNPGPSIYMQVQSQQIQLLLAHRSGATERALIERMLSRRELVRNGTSPSLEALQLDLLDMTPRDPTDANRQMTYMR